MQKIINWTATFIVVFSIYILCSAFLGCATRPPIQNGPTPTCDVVCKHVEQELGCTGLQTVNQRGCYAMCDNLFTAGDNGDDNSSRILKCWVASGSCDQLDTCDN